MYKIDSPHAEEFINHDEILATLDYAQANKGNRELIRSIIEKALQGTDSSRGCRVAGVRRFQPAGRNICFGT